MLCPVSQIHVRQSPAQDLVVTLQISSYLTLLSRKQMLRIQSGHQQMLPSCLH